MNPSSLSVSLLANVSGRMSCNWGSFRSKTVNGFHWLLLSVSSDNVIIGDMRGGGWARIALPFPKTRTIAFELVTAAEKDVFSVEEK